MLSYCKIAVKFGSLIGSSVLKSSLCNPSRSAPPNRPFLAKRIIAEGGKCPILRCSSRIEEFDAIVGATMFIGEDNDRLTNGRRHTDNRKPLAPCGCQKQLDITSSADDERREPFGFRSIRGEGIADTPLIRFDSLSCTPNFLN